MRNALSPELRILYDFASYNESISVFDAVIILFIFFEIFNDLIVMRFTSGYLLAPSSLIFCPKTGISSS